MNDKPLPPKMYEKWGHLPHLRYKGKSGGLDVWHSACPNCGEAGHNPASGKPDRFFIQTAGEYEEHGVCRRCRTVEWLNSSESFRADPAKIKAAEEIRREWQVKEDARIARIMDDYAAQKVWEYYHDNLQERHRLSWRRQGIPDSYQDYFRVGWTDSYAGSGFTSPAFTIPFFGHGWTPTTLQYRLVKPPKPQDKYRILKGLKQQLHLTEPDKKFSGRCILVEGAKKSMVTFINHIVEGRNYDDTVVAVPSAQAFALLPQLEGFDEVVVVLDPDQYSGAKDILGNEGPAPIWKFVKKMVNPVIRIAKPSSKPDDMFVKYKATPRDFKAMIDDAIQVRPKKSYTVHPV